MRVSLLLLEAVNLLADFGDCPLHLAGNYAERRASVIYLPRAHCHFVHARLHGACRVMKLAHFLQT